MSDSEVLMGSGFVEVDEGQIYFESLGSGSAVVLIHAGGMNRRMWDDQFSAFASGYRVIRYAICAELVDLTYRALPFPIPRT